MEILPGVHHIPGITANVFLIVGDDGLTLIDCGLPRSHRRILSYLEGLGHAPADLTSILITHADVDHYGGLSALVTASGAAAMAETEEARAIGAGAMSRPLKLSGILRHLFSLSTRIYRPRAVRVTRHLRPGDVLPVLDGLEVLATPGHTPGHISLWAPKFALLFAGDSLRADQNGLHPSRGVNTWDEALALKSAKEQHRLAPAIVCAGHGPVVRAAAGKFKL